MPRPALGLIETSGIDGAIKATRAASDSGQVVIVSAEQGSEGRMTVKIEGEWGAVQNAVEAGARAAYQSRELVSVHVIPKPDQDVDPILPYSRFVDRFRPSDAPRRPAEKPVHPKSTRSAPLRKRSERPPLDQSQPPAPRRSSPGEPAAAPSAAAVPMPGTSLLPAEQLEQMAVVVLRRYARTIPQLPIKGREISKANKQQLLEAIASVRKTIS